MHIYHIFLTYSSVLEYLGYFQSFAEINMGVQVALLYPGLYTFQYMPRSGSAGS
jgi:hypothetical protein